MGEQSMFFKSRYEKDLDSIIEKIQMNMSNNYKDAAQENLKDLEQALEAYMGEKKISGKVADDYISKLDTYKSKLKGYTHKDQKPYWT